MSDSPLAHASHTPRALDAWRVAVVGTGGWSRIHLAALSASPRVREIVLCGRNPQALAGRAAEFPRVTHTVSHWDAICDDPDVRLVNVVLPHHLHAEVTAQALAAGKHVICEKPGATTLADFDRVSLAAQQRGARLALVMNQLANPITLRVRQLVDEGVIGRPFLSVENAYSQHGKWYRDPQAWRTSTHECGGGVLIDGGFHLIYRHLFFLASCGWPTWVSADTPQLNVSSDGHPVPEKGEDAVSITVGYRSALRLQWSHAWTLAATPQRSRQVFLCGTEGTLEFTDRAEEPLVLHRATGQQSIEVEPGPRTGPETTHAWILDCVERLYTGRDLGPSSLELARRTLEIILQAYASGAAGKRVELSSG